MFKLIDRFLCGMGIIVLVGFAAGVIYLFVRAWMEAFPA